MSQNNDLIKKELQKVWNMEKRIPHEIVKKVEDKLSNVFPNKNVSQINRVVNRFFNNPLNFGDTRFKRAFKEGICGQYQMDTLGDFYSYEDNLRPKIGINGISFWIDDNVYTYRENKKLYELTQSASLEKLKKGEKLSLEEVRDKIVKYLKEKEF